MATHDTHTWDDTPTGSQADHLERKREEARQRGEELERQANRQAWREWNRQSDDR
jgi:hypothetical protein